MIYGVSPLIQEKEVDAYCFGSCGKIIIGGLDGGDCVGSLLPCREIVCEYEGAL